MYRNLVPSKKAVNAIFPNSLKSKLPRDLSDEKKRISHCFGNSREFDYFFLALRSYDECPAEELVTQKSTRPFGKDQNELFSLEPDWYYARTYKIFKKSHSLIFRKVHSRQRIELLEAIFDAKSPTEILEFLREYPIMKENNPEHEGVHCHEDHWNQGFIYRAQVPVYRKVDNLKGWFYNHAMLEDVRGPFPTHVVYKTYQYLEELLDRKTITSNFSLRNAALEIMRYEKVIRKQQFLPIKFEIRQEYSNICPLQDRTFRFCDEISRNSLRFSSNKLTLEIAENCEAEKRVFIDHAVRNGLQIVKIFIRRDSLITIKSFQQVQKPFDYQKEFLKQSFINAKVDFRGADEFSEYKIWSNDIMRVFEAKNENGSPEMSFTLASNHDEILRRTQNAINEWDDFEFRRRSWIEEMERAREMREFVENQIHIRQMVAEEWRRRNARRIAAVKLLHITRN